MIHGNSALQSCAWVSGVLSIGFAGAIVAAELVVAAQRRRQPKLLRLPNLEEQDEAAHRNQRRADIDDPGIDVVGDHELRERERDAGDQHRRPDVLHALPAGKRPYHPERHDQREHRQLPSDHRAENIGIETGHRSETLNRGTERAVGNRGGIGDQRQAGRGERREAEADQNRPGHGNRRAEAGSAFEKCPERKRDQQQLQAPVLGHTADGALQQVETPGCDREAVEEDDVQDDPADREEPGHHPEQTGANRHAGRHGEDEYRDEIGGDQRNDGGDMRLDLAACDQNQQRDDGYRRGDRRKHRVVKGIIDLIPHCDSSPRAYSASRPA